MAADYSSTARALSLPISPGRSASPSILQPPWGRRQPHGRQPSRYSNRPTSSFRDDLLSNAQKLNRRLTRFYEGLTPVKKALLWLLLVLEIVVVILFIKYNGKIFAFLRPYAASWKQTTGGWTILWSLTFVTAFPPVIGFSACATLAGFIYGIGEGWLILASAAVLGSLCSFLASRFVLRRYVERLIANDRRFAALALTLKHDGLKLLCMIRLCPLPYSICNGGMSTFPTVHPLMYALATAITSPRLLIHVFIGSRLSALGENGGQMSTGAKAVNWISITIGGLVGMFTGWYIYKGTMARARQLEAEEQANTRQAVDRPGAPPGDFMDDPESQAASPNLGQGDEIDLNFADDQEVYRDGLTDDDDNLFDHGDEDAEAMDMGRHQGK